MINSFTTNAPILHPPWKQQEACDFLVFSGGIKWEYWPEEIS